MNLEKVALITVAGSGIGPANAMRLVEDGYAVVLTGRRQDALEKTARLSHTDAKKSSLSRAMSLNRTRFVRCCPAWPACR